MILRWRKKPVVIQAVRWDGHNVDEVITFVGTSGRMLDTVNCFAIITKEGTMVAELGDFIIKGVKGEFYPCKPDIFEASYEPEGVRPNARVRVVVAETGYVIQDEQVLSLILRNLLTGNRGWCGGSFKVYVDGVEQLVMSYPEDEEG
jgi:hypothetical protein